MNNDAYDRHDEALEWLSPYGPDLEWGFTSHHPMVVEALCALDRGDAALPWLEAHRRGLLPRPRPVRPLDARHWRGALGRAERWADWCEHLESELAAERWQDVLARWVARLAPGLCAAAAHGVIRTAHAARALSVADTPLRRAELAAALGYWAANWQTLPAPDEPEPRPVAARAALRSLPLLHPGRPPQGFITQALAALADVPEFAPVLGRLDVERPAAAVVDDLTESFARVFLANVHDRLTAVVFTHAITSTAGLRALAPHLAEPALRDALRRAWQTGAALFTSYASAPPLDGDVAAPREEPKALVDLALANGDDHAIKLVEACLSEHARRPLPVYLAAARRGIDLLR